MNHNKPHVVIIGAGASGLVTAWLLEKDYRVTLLEKENYLGGHVATITVTVQGQEHHIEAGAEFFSDMMFRQFNRLLEILQVPTRKYPLSYTFYNTKTAQTLVLPPVQDGHIVWRSCAPDHWFDLIHFKQFVDQGTTIVALEDQQITLKDYTDGLGLPDNFKEHFLYPFFAASWGVSPRDIQHFTAYDILKWVLKNKPANIQAAHWNEIPGGMNTYVNSLQNQLQNTRIVLNCGIIKLRKDTHGFTLNLPGEQLACDHVVIATHAETASSLLRDIHSTHALQNALNKIEYFTAHIAIHADTRLMPPHRSDWSAANIAYDNTHSALTIAKPWMQTVPLFRSWITYNVWTDAPTILPEPLYALRTYRHPTVTPAYFTAQKEIAALQGSNNIWIAGFYTHDTDSHNSAIVSAITIAQKLAPHSARLAQLTS